MNSLFLPQQTAFICVKLGKWINSAHISVISENSDGSSSVHVGDTHYNSKLSANQVLAAIKFVTGKITFAEFENLGGDKKSITGDW